MKNAIMEYMEKKYQALPEYLWRKYPSAAVFRHSDNRKWFALQMEISRAKLGLDRDELVEMINLKVEDMFFRDILVQQDGIMPAYHMNKQHWITVLLDGTVKQEQVFDLIDASYAATASSKKKMR